MQPPNGILKPNKKLMRLTMPKTYGKKWHILLRASVVVMLLACIVTPILRHYLVYWINLSTQSSPEDPYTIINGFAETEEEYDPLVLEVRADWDAALVELDKTLDIDAVHDAQTITYYNLDMTDPKPTDIAIYSLANTIYFKDVESTKVGLAMLGEYYVSKGYVSTSEELFLPSQKFEPNPYATDEENALKKKEFVPEVVRFFELLKSTEDIEQIKGTQAQNLEWTDDDAFSSVQGFFPRYDYSVGIVINSGGLPLSSLPKFEGNAKEKDLHKLDSRFNMRDGTTDYDMCPLKPSTFTDGGWDPKYGCLDD